MSGSGAGAGVGAGASRAGDDLVSFPGPETRDDVRGAGPETDGAAAAFALGMKVDVQDSVGKWCEAVIADVGPDAVYVHYVFWSSKWDEEIPRTSTRLAPYRSHIYHVGGTLRVGQRVDVFDRHETRRVWCHGEVVAERADAVRVHFYGWTSRWDEWHRRDSEYLAPFGKYSRKRRQYRPKAAQYWSNRKRQRLVLENNEKWRRYLGGVSAMGLVLVQCEGDGNCLFRALSHQIYGTQDFHMHIRLCAVEYMRIHANWFKPFVSFDDASFNAYLAAKSTDGVWGDDPEIQAVCELYDRPAQLYVFHSEKGATQLRTFHSAQTDSGAQPLRLSYYGGGHYDSLVPTRWTPSDPSVIRTEPKTFEEARFAVMRAQVAAADSAGSTPTSESKTQGHAGLTSSIQASRDEFDANDCSVEDALVAHLARESDWQATQAAIVKDTLRASVEERGRAQMERDLKEVEDSMVRDAQAASSAATLEQSLIEEAKRASAAETLEDRLIEEVKRSSVAELVGGGTTSGASLPASAATAAGDGGTTDADVATALEASKREELDRELKAAEDAELAAAIAASRAGAATGGAAGQASGGTADDDIMAAVLAQSRQEAGLGDFLPTDILAVGDDTDMDPATRAALMASMFDST